MPDPRARIFTFTDDFVFKYIFGRKSQEPLLAKLLNALLQREGNRQITEVEILNPYNAKETASAKASIVDVKAMDQAGRRFLVEVQVKSRPDQVARSLFYLSRLFTEQLGGGEPYEDLCQATAVSLLGFRLFRQHSRVQSVFRFREADLGFELSDLLDLHFLELPKVAEFLA
ncbi:MAG: Rpn family recombination-promoting nuclease/putative transposase, partial [Candidatus Riflebacteria bacterium]|nr:Rpn family recombination-promoting nuclease/putative transposase [Candidatus Riflebacteria bacterium]